MICVPKAFLEGRFSFSSYLYAKKSASSKKELKYDLIEKCRIHFTHGRKNKYVCFKPCDKNDHVLFYLISNVSKSLRVLAKKIVFSVCSAVTNF